MQVQVQLEGQGVYFIEDADLAPSTTPAILEVPNHSLDCIFRELIRDLIPWRHGSLVGNNVHCKYMRRWDVIPLEVMQS